MKSILFKIGHFFFRKNIYRVAYIIFKIRSISSFDREISIGFMSACLEELDKPKQALNLLLKIEEPNEYNNIFEIACLYGRMGDYNNSVQRFEKILDQNILLDRKIDYQLISNLIDGYTRIEKYENAITLVEKYIEFLPEEKADSTLYFNTGCLYQELENFGEAIKYYLLAVESGDLGDTKNYLNLSICYDKQKDYDKALAYIDKAIEFAKVKPEIAKAHFVKGCIFEDINNKAEAIKYFQIALKYGHPKAKEAIKECQ